MIEKLLFFLGGLVIWVISSLGYLGIILCMAIESACIPLPSEIIMPFSGYLVWQGQFTLFGIALAGAFGCLVGSVATYYIGLWGGRPLLEKYGRYVLISGHDLDQADRFFARFGDEAIFISRLLPVVRTFISLPAGIAKMNPVKFSFYTFTGSFFWCWALGWLGYKLGEHWNTLGGYFHRFDIIIGVMILAGIGVFLYRHLKKG
jgi:membrane protein DedA with SNARE-associated domain